MSCINVDVSALDNFITTNIQACEFQITILSMRGDDQDIQYYFCTVLFSPITNDSSPIHFDQIRIIIKNKKNIYNAKLFYKTQKIQQQKISKSKNHLKKNLKHSAIFDYFRLYFQTTGSRFLMPRTFPELSSRYRTQDTSIAPCGINERPMISILGLCTDLSPLTVTAGEP